MPTHLRHNFVLPVRQHAVGGGLERLGGREQRLVDRSVPESAVGVSVGVSVWRWRSVLAFGVGVRR